MFNWRMLQQFGEDTVECAAVDGQQAAQSEDSQPQRASFSQLMEDPEYNREMQNIVKNRLKDARGAELRLQKLDPVLTMLQDRYGLDPDNPDTDHLAEALGQSTQPADMDLTGHFQCLEDQEQRMKQLFPEFDLRQELENPAFARMTAPDVGISVEDAYYAIHRSRIQQDTMELAARNLADKMSRALQSGSRRPRESGTAPAAVAAFDYRSASREQREAMKQQLRLAWGRGEKVYPR